MGNSNYKNIGQVSKKFGLKVRSIDIFPVIEPQPIGSWLAESLEMAKTSPLMNVKSRSERLISPILLDIVKHFSTQITLFSGETVEINADYSLHTDFVFALQTPKPYIDTSVLSFVQAQGENREQRLAECAAQVYANFKNTTDNQSFTPYGCAITNSSEWQFFKFENNTFYVEHKPMTDLPQVLGTWHWILNYYVTTLKNV
jgi:hypothetical protein